MNLLGMKAALDIICDLSVDDIQKHNHSLIDRLADCLSKSDFYQISSSLVEKERSSIFTFTCDDHSSLFKYMLGKKIKAADREGSIRVAVHLFNNEADIDRLIEVLADYEKRYRVKTATGGQLKTEEI